MEQFKQEKNQERFFDDEKNQYDLNLIKNPPLHVQAEISNLISKVKKLNIKSLVEFGSGTGRLTLPLLKNNYIVNAVDISQRSLLKLKLIAQKFKLAKNLSLYRSIDTSIQTNLIMGCDILHHVELEKYLGIFYKKLNKNGGIIFSEPNSLNIYWMIYITLFASWQAEKGIFQCNYFNLTRKLKKAKFKDIKIDGFGLFPSSLLSWSQLLLNLNIFLGNLPILKYFSVRLIITARK